MTSVIGMLCAGIVVFALVVIIHEFAHFSVARWFGVKTECFSVGFGPTVWSRTAKDGTLYRLALIPLGGYVKMKGERPGGSLDQSMPADSFLAKPIGQRMLVVLAGPVSNFILAFLLFWLLLWGGRTIVKPVVGKVVKESIAWQAGLKQGDQLLSVGGKPVTQWSQVVLNLATHLGGRGQLNLEVRPANAALTTRKNLHFNLSSWRDNALSPNPLLTLGIVPYRPTVSLRVASVVHGDGAAQAGVRAGDVIAQFNQIKIKDWQQLQSILADYTADTALLTVARQGRNVTLPIKLGFVTKASGGTKAVLGIRSHAESWPAAMLNRESFSFFQQIGVAASQVGFYTVINAKILGRLITGHLSMQSIGGPVMIFHVAGQAASGGWRTYIHLIALISLLVGFFNLLPIPLVDGGVFVFQVVEWLRSKPAPIWVQNLSAAVGGVLLIYCLVQATMNDFMRFF